MTDPKKDFDDLEWLNERHRSIVELMQKRAINNRQETYVQFGMITAAILLACALILAVM